MNQYDLEFEKFINWRSDHVIHLPYKFDDKLSEDIIRKYKERLYWNEISMYQQLSEDFIKEFSDKVDWANICFSQKLSCKFIKEFSNEVNWNYVCSKQKLSIKFIEEFSDKIYLQFIPLCCFNSWHQRSWGTFL